jgi:DNA-binding NarL/FixJ family response regulator
MDHERLPEIVRSTREGERPWLLGIEEEELAPLPRVVPGEEPLTTTERVVLDLVYRGHTNPEIALELSVSLSTVKTHMSHILRKTGRSSRREL